MKRAWHVFLALVLVAAALGAAYAVRLILLGAIRFIGSFESELAAALVVTSGTIILGLFTVILTSRYSRQREISEAHRPQKAAAYARFMETMVVDILREVQAKRSPSEDGMAERYREFFLTFTAELIVWGSPGIIRAFRRFRSKPTTDQKTVPPDQKKMLLDLDDILSEIRKDLGNSNWGLERGDLISMYLHNPDDIKKI